MVYCQPNVNISIFKDRNQRDVLDSSSWDEGKSILPAEKGMHDLAWTRPALGMLRKVTQSGRSPYKWQEKGDRNLELLNSEKAVRVLHGLLQIALHWTTDQKAA